MVNTTYEQIDIMLYKCKNVHKELKQQVAFNKHDKKHAFYLLQGSAITVTTLALEFNRRGLMGPLLQQTRMLHEIINLIAFFNELSNDSRFIKAWYSEKLFTREFDKGLSLEEGAKKYNVTTEHLKLVDEITQKTTHLLSKYSHPSFEIIRANSSPITHYFDYEHVGTASMGMTTQMFAEKHMVHCISSLLIPNELLKIPQGKYDDLRKNSLAIQGRA